MSMSSLFERTKRSVCLTPIRLTLLINGSALAYVLLASKLVTLQRWRRLNKAVGWVYAISLFLLVFLGFKHAFAN
jgi:hypothetical protein